MGGCSRSLSEFVKDEFEAFLECGILAHGFLRVRCTKCAHEKVVGFSCKRRGICPSWGTRRMAETTTYLVDHVNTYKYNKGERTVGANGSFSDPDSVFKAISAPWSAGRNRPTVMQVDRSRMRVVTSW